MVAKNTRKKTAAKTSKRTSITARKKPQVAGTDYKAKYYDLLNKVKTANAAKRADLNGIKADVDGLFKVTCDPDPPGCSQNKFEGSLDDLVKQVSDGNANKYARVGSIRGSIEKLLQKICDPIPPGC